MLNDLLLNFALLVAGAFALSLTYRQATLRDSWLRLSGRYATTVTVALLLLFNSVQIGPGLLFDFRTVLVALAARRYGLLPGLLVALPIAVYRLIRGGPTAGVGVLNLVLVALLAAHRSGWLRFNPQPGESSLHRRWWIPLGIFGCANLTTFLAFQLTRQPWVDAVAVYLAFSSLSAVGLLVAHLVIRSRLQALNRVERLENLAYLDPLTGSFNRRRFDDDYLQLHQPAYLLLLDLDQFKRINDTYGHELGDQVLIQTVQVLRDNLRPLDGIYRLGGEEFAVMLAPCDPDSVEEVANRLRAQVEQRVAEQAGLWGDTVTVSGGWVRVDGEKRRVLRQADERLYLAKTGGRNRIVGERVLLVTA